MTPHTRGFLLTLFGVLVLTPDTLLVRLVATDIWTMTAWRGLLGGGAIVLAFLAWRGRAAPGEVLALGWPGLAVCAFNAGNSVFFVLALGHTSVASTLIILATTPLITALMSFAFLREPVSGPTWAAIVAGFGGIAIVVMDGLGRSTVIGDGFALITAAALAGSFVIIRRHRDRNMVPATGLGALLSGVLTLPAADLLSLSGPQVPLILIMGLVVVPVPFGLLTLGPRTVSAPEVALLLLLETVLGPIWVWLGVGERPSDAAFVGGGIVLATLVAHSAWRLRRAPRR